MKKTSDYRVLLPILTVNFIGVMGFSIVLPFLVFLVERFGGNALVYGIVGATYPFFQLIGAPILGKWSDVYGRKKILFLSHAGTALAWLVFLIAFLLPLDELTRVDDPFWGTFAITLPLLIVFLSRALDGLTGGNIAVANAYMGDITNDDNRKRYFGYMSMSSNLGFIFGPLIAGFLGATAYGESMPVLAAFVISIVGMVVIGKLMPESHPALVKKTGDDNTAAFSTKVSLKEVVKLPHIPYMLLLNFLIFMGFNLFYTAFPVHALEMLGWKVIDMGQFFAIIAGIMVVIQGPVLSRLGEHFSSAALAIFGSLVLGANFILMASPDTTIIYIGGVLFAIGNGIMWPSVLAMISQLAGEKYQGSVQGIAMGFGSLAAIIGLLVGGLLYELVGPETFYYSSGVIYLVFVLLLKVPGFFKGQLKV